MKQKIFSIFAIIIFSIAFAQKKAEKTITFSEDIKKIYINNFSGIPLVLTSKSLTGINPLKAEKIWTKDLSKLGNITTLTGDAESLVNEIPLTPYSILENKTLIDTRNGNVLLDNKKIQDYRVFDEVGGIFFITNSESGEKEFSFLDLKSASIKWKNNVKVKTSLMDKAIALADNKESVSPLKSIILSGGKYISLIYGKSLLTFNVENGKNTVNESEKIGYIFTNSTGNSLFAVEGKPGFIPQMRSLDDIIHVYDLNSGKELNKIKLEDTFKWEQIDGNNVFIKTKKDIMLYDSKGENVWKRPFSEKGIYKIEKNSSGYLVNFGRKEMQLDNSGKEAWKKAKESTLVYSDKDYDFMENSEYSHFKYNSGVIDISTENFYFGANENPKANNYNVNLYNSGDKSLAKYAYEPKSKSILLIDFGQIGKEELYFINPDLVSGKPSPQRINLKKPEYFDKFQKTQSGYFVSSPWEYLILNEKGEITKQKYYSTPGETGRKLLNVGSSILGTAAGVSELSGIANVTGGVTSAMGFQIPSTDVSDIDKGINQYDRAETMYEMSELLYNPNRKNSYKELNDYAFFYTKDDTAKYLVQVNKNNGEEVEKFKFNDNNPVYEIDDVASQIYYGNKNVFEIFSFKK